MNLEIEDLKARRALTKKCAEVAATDMWRCRMEAEYWILCRLIKAARLGIPYGKLLEDDPGDTE